MIMPLYRLSRWLKEEVMGLIVLEWGNLWINCGGISMYLIAGSSSMTNCCTGIEKKRKRRCNRGKYRDCAVISRISR